MKAASCLHKSPKIVQIACLRRSEKVVLVWFYILKEQLLLFTGVPLPSFNFICQLRKVVSKMTHFGVASRETPSIRLQSAMVSRRFCFKLFETPATYNILDYLNCYMKILEINTMNAVRRSLKNCSKSWQISAFRDWILGECSFWSYRAR